MAFLDEDGKQLYYEVQGEGHPLVLIHSALMDSGMYGEQVKAFSPHFRVITYDLYGYGQSAFTEQKIVDHSKDLQALLYHLKAEKAYVLGTSMGAEIALSFALDYPALVDGLILVGAGLEGYDYPEESLLWWGSFIGAIKERDFTKAIDIFIPAAIDSTSAPLTPELRAAIVKRMQNYSFRHYFDDSLLWPSAEKPPAQRLGEIRCPTLVMVGAGDPMPVMLDIADTLAKGIPKAEKAVVPGAAHLVNLQQPQAFNKAVVEFLGDI